MSSQQDNDSQIDGYHPSIMPSLDDQIQIKNKRRQYKNISSESDQDFDEQFSGDESSLSNQSSGSDYMRNIKMNNKEKFRGRRPNPLRINQRGGGRGRRRGGLKNDIQMTRKKIEQIERHKIDEIFMESQAEGSDQDRKNRNDDSDQSVQIPTRKKKDESDSDEDEQHDIQKQEKEQILSEMKQKPKEPMFAPSDDQQSDIQEEKNYKSHMSGEGRQSNPVKIEDAASQYLDLDDQLISNLEVGSILSPEEIERRNILREQKKNSKIYAENFPDYKRRRIMKFIDGKIDVNVRYLHELVYDCYEEGLICEELMLSIKYMGLGNSLEFIKKYNEEKLSQFDFKKVKFTVFDHRRLVKLLKQKGTKKQYTDEKTPYFMPYQLNQFMNQVYALHQDTYEALCYSLDEVYQLNWWKTIGTELKGKQALKEIIKNSQENVPAKIIPKKFPRKTKLEQKGNGGKMQEQPKEASKKIKEKPKKAEKAENPPRDQQQIFRKLIQDEPSYLESSLAFDTDLKKSVTERSSIFSSSMLDTQKLLNSDFSMDSDTHSLSDLSDLIDDQSSKVKKKMSKNTKEILQQQEMQKVKKSAANLKKVEQNYKNPSKPKKQAQTKKQSKKPKKKTKNSEQKQKKVKKLNKRKAKKKQKSQISEFSSSFDISNSSGTKKQSEDYSDSQSI